MIRDLLDRFARRAATALGGGAIVSGDELGITLGTLIILAEFGIQSWRKRRAMKKAGK